jgi:ABC-type nitrate/sulfonate/bicarbonate transport system substrate-binding protein
VNAPFAATAAFCLLTLPLAAAPLTPVDVQLDWKANAQFAGLIVAKEQGWYEEAGLDVAIHPNDFKRPYIDVVATSDHTIGSSESRSLVAARGQGVPIRAVATIFQQSPIVLLSKAAQNIHAVADLQGKTIGIHRPEDAGMLDALFANAGIAQPRYQAKKVGFAMKEFLAGDVDAVQGYSVSELVQLRRDGVAVNSLPLAANGWVDYSEVLFVSESFLKQNPDAIGKFLAVTFRGWQWAISHIPETAKLVVAKYAPDLDPAFEEDSLRQIAPLLTVESPHMGLMRPETWQAIFAQCTEHHLATPPAHIEDLVDFRFLPGLGAGQ